MFHQALQSCKARNHAEQALHHSCSAHAKQGLHPLVVARPSLLDIHLLHRCPLLSLGGYAAC